jgi:uncharacterized membrane protein YdcZ (DUF606 family)
MAVFYLALAVVAGGMLPLQAAINARLARVLGGPTWAAAVSGLILTVALVVVASAATGVDLALAAWMRCLGGHGPVDSAERYCFRRRRRRPLGSAPAT